MKERRFSCAASQKIKLGRRETFPDIAHRVPKHELQLLMTKTQLQAAKAIGISPTTLKKLCRYYGITRWPFRQIAATSRAANRLDAMIAEQPVQQQSTVTLNPPVEDHHQGNAVGGAAMLRADITQDPNRCGTKITPKSSGTPIVHPVGAARGTAFANDEFPSSTSASNLHLLKRSGGGGTTNVSTGFTGYIVDSNTLGSTHLAATHPLATEPSFLEF